MKAIQIRISIPMNILFLYFATKSINVFPSGMPQIADILLILGIVIIIYSNRGVIYIPAEHSKHIKICSMIVVYQRVVNFIWAIALGNTQFISRSMYYVFNFIAYVYIFILCKYYGYESVVKTTISGCIASAVVSFGGVMLLSGQAFRKNGFFNNPNQLGYFSIVLVAFAFCIFKNDWKKYLVYTLSVVMIILSGSKASFAGLFIFFFLVIITSENTKKQTIVWKMIVLILLSVGLYLIMYSDIGFIARNSEIINLRVRFSNLEADDNLWTGRGYERITEIGYHFLWGMGEGGFDRFTTLKGIETHSAYVTILLSYGLIGLIGYCYIFKKTVGKSFIQIKKSITALSGILFYNVTHNGIRNTLVWMLLAMICLEHYYARINVEEKPESISEPVIIEGDLYGRQARLDKE